MKEPLAPHGEGHSKGQRETTCVHHPICGCETDGTLRQGTNGNDCWPQTPCAVEDSSTENQRLTPAGAVQDALDPRGQGFPGPLRCGLVGGFTGLADTDRQIEPFAVLDGGPAPAPFRCVHEPIMYQQIILDKPLVRVFNVPTLNQEAAMKSTAEMSFNDLAGELGNQEWIVNLAPNTNGLKRMRVMALSEQGACMEVEDRFGVTAISARLATVNEKY
jgi:hypothetical protein